MMRKLLALTSAAILLLPTAVAVAAPALPQAAPASESNIRVIHVSVKGGGNQNITMGLNKAVIVELDSDVKEVTVASPDIVDAVPKSPRRVFLIAGKVGQTNAFFDDAQGRHLLSLDIRVERDTADLDALMAQTMPNTAIKVTAIADNIVLSGKVASAADASRAVSLANGFTGDPKKVVNMLTVIDGQQVTVKVRIAEMNRSISKQLGVNLSNVTFSGSTPFIFNSSNPYGLLGHALSQLSGAQLGQICGNGSTQINPLAAVQGGGACQPINTDTQATINALEQVGLIHLLDEPNLTAVSGETARFLAGGEFPIPVARDNNGNITVDYKQFGVGLSFTPVVLSGGQISMQISTEVSELSSTGSYQIGSGSNALTVPALQVRRASTTVVLPSGGSFAIAGLMQHNNKQTIDGIPGAKDMPVLGALFRSRDYQNDETELVVIATVYLSGPTSDQKLAAPTDGFKQPTDPETMLLGRLNAIYKDKDTTGPATAAAPGGFIVQ